MLIPIATPDESVVNFRADASKRPSMAAGNEAFSNWPGGTEPSGGEVVMSISR
jgi:hypothetical protein